MAKNITLFGQDFSNVPAINVPLQGGGTARFIDEDEGGGGGGSGDFSTAEVTIINNTSDMGINFLMPTFMETPFISSSYLSEPIFAHQTVVASVILYKNKGGIAVRNYDRYETKPNFAVTGSIEYIGDGEFDITGDCTITIS